MEYLNSSTIFSQIDQFPWSSHHFAIHVDLFRSTVLIAFAALFLAKLTECFVVGKNSKQRPPLPPHPTHCWPLIGNLPQIWLNKPTFIWIHDLMYQLDTDIACIRVANTYVIPVTSPEMARQFLKAHDSTFASRPVTKASEYVSGGFLSTALVPSGHQWKKMRKIIACNLLNPPTLSRLLPKRNQEADNLVSFVYNQCMNGGGVINLRLVTRQYTGNVIRRMMFNKRYFGRGQQDGGPGLEEEEHVESLFTVLKCLYAFALSDYVPWLRPLDLEGHENIVRKATKIINGYHDPIIDERVEQWRQAKRKESQDLLDAFILAKDSNGKPALSVDEIKAQCTELMLATVDNPSNTVEWAIAEMLNRPHILQKARDEIDNIVGKDRLVQEADLPQLNYVKACAREALRIHPVTAFNIPHVSNADTTVAGYFIPKGSHVLISRVGLGRNPRVWEEPLEFRPERHLNDGPKVDLQTDTQLRFFSFSTGRRGCMGVALGSEITIMLLARLIQGFQWGVPHGDPKIDLAQSKNDLQLAKPLHAFAIPRLCATLYRC